MTTRNRGGASAEDSPQELIERLLRELARSQPNDRILDTLRAPLIEMGEAYVFSLVARIQHARTEEEGLRLAMLIQVLGDPRLIKPLEAIAKDPKASSQARKIAEIGLLDFGVLEDLDQAIDPALLNGPLPEEIRKDLDGFIAMLEGTGREAALEGIAAFVTTVPPVLSKLLLTYMARQHGAQTLPVLEHLAQLPDAQVVTSAIAALTDMEHPHALRILERVAESPPDLATGQVARAAVDQLRSRGVQRSDVEPLRTPERWTIRRVLLSNMDGIGSRMIFFECALPDGQAAIVDVCVNDIVGLKDCVGKVGNPKAIAKDMDKVCSRMRDGMLIEEADPAYCHWLTHEAKQKNRGSHFPLPMGCHSWLAPLGPPARQYDAPLCYQFLDAKQLNHDDDDLDLSESLLDEPEFRGWLLNPEDVLPFAQQLRQAAPRGDDEAEERIVREAAARLFTVELRRLYARRLEEMAYLYWLGSDTQVAADCLRVAGRFHTETVPINQIAFAMGMVEDSIRMTADALDHGVNIKEISRTPWDPIP